MLENNVKTPNIWNVPDSCAFLRRRKRSNNRQSLSESDCCWYSSPSNETSVARVFLMETALWLVEERGEGQSRCSVDHRSFPDSWIPRSFSKNNSDARERRYYLVTMTQFEVVQFTGDRDFSLQWCRWQWFRILRSGILNFYTFSQIRIIHSHFRDFCFLDTYIYLIKRWTLKVIFKDYIYILITFLQSKSTNDNN